MIDKIKTDLKNVYFVSDTETYKHSLRVAKNFKDSLKIIALLHDVVEDGKSTYEDLKNKYILSEEILIALDAITRRKNEKYFDYINRVKANELAIKIKIVDLLDNINRNKDDKYFDSLRKRYYKALDILMN